MQRTPQFWTLYLLLQQLESEKDYQLLSFGDANQRDPSSIGKWRSRVDNRQSSMKMEFQESNKALLDRMEQSQREIMLQQQRWAKHEQQQME